VPKFRTKVPWVLKNGVLALVGQSGCGKSTCIQLLERFYNGSGGNIKMDNHRICELNLKWLRNQIGFVQQEPILFNKTIEENILYGLDQSGTSSTDKNKVGVKNVKNQFSSIISQIISPIIYVLFSRINIWTR